MNVLITGGAGFIGFHLARFHASHGDRVHLLDSFFKSQGRSDQDFDKLKQSSNVAVHLLDMTNPLSGLAIPEPLDVVYHLAAVNGTRLFYEIPYDVARINLLATINLLDWLRGRSVGRIVYTSTSEVYAGAEAFGLLPLPTPESVPCGFPAAHADSFFLRHQQVHGRVPLSAFRHHE
jgi:nucleoside-diphosphate-sugar epimerase